MDVPTRMPTPTFTADDVPLRSAPVISIAIALLVWSNSADMVAESTRIAAPVLVCSNSAVMVAESTSVAEAVDVCVKFAD